MTSLGEQAPEDLLAARMEEAAETLAQEEEVICIQGPGFPDPRPSALERFKHRVEEIALEAEIYARSALAGSHVEERRSGRHGAAGMRQQIRNPGPEMEAGDSVPFGLKRRLAVGHPVFNGRERRNPADRARPLRDDAQLEQIRRAIRQTALDLLADMLEIDAGLRKTRRGHGGVNR